MWGGYVLRFLRIYRNAQSVRSKFLKILCKIILRRYRIKYGLEIPIEAHIGKGLYIGHAFNITINPHVVIGDNCNLHKGCLIGQENRGEERSPKIGQ